MKANQSPVPVVALAANVVMAVLLAGLMGHLGIGGITIRAGVISGAAIWLGFVATTQAMNYSFGKRPLKLVLIDSGRWLAVLLLQGVAIGFMSAS